MQIPAIKFTISINGNTSILQPNLERNEYILLDFKSRREINVPQELQPTNIPTLWKYQTHIKFELWTIRNYEQYPHPHRKDEKSFHGLTVRVCNAEYRFCYRTISKWFVRNLLLLLLSQCCGWFIIFSIKLTTWFLQTWWFTSFESMSDKFANALVVHLIN